MHDAPAITFLDDVLKLAIDQRASDIHIEWRAEHLLVRFRIDGLLVSKSTLDHVLGLQVVSRIKVLAALNVAERRLPQDGSYSASIAQRIFDIRVATFPAVHGEKVVLRILERSFACKQLADLGLEHTLFERITSLLQASSGFLLVTGPTGSGKTTTLHALLSALTTEQKNIMTLEDPVEYTLDAITQTHIYPALGFTFEKGLRSLLRTDPDIIMVGEMRDKETAHVALQAAMTGHFVMSTLHTIDAPGALLRLRDMAIEPFLINASVTAILAQRLARRLCLDCRHEQVADKAEQTLMNRLQVQGKTIHKSSGCSACLGTGYSGRVGIFSLLSMSHRLRALMNERSDYQTLSECAQQEGMRPLAYDAAKKIENGITSLSEVMRIL